MGDVALRIPHDPATANPLPPSPLAAGSGVDDTSAAPAAFYPIVGIDPGLSGALAFYDSLGLITEDMPTLEFARGGKSKRDLDLQALAHLIRVHGPVHAYVEQVGAMPGQGVSSMFAFGKTYGGILGVLAALKVPVTLVPPQRWKKVLGVPAGKDGARARASQLIPAHAAQWPLKKHDGRAEAAMLALYGIRSFERIAA